MKKLILSLSFITFSAFANSGQEISDNEIPLKLMAVVKDAQVEDLLKKTPEFKDCQPKTPYVENDKMADQKLDTATKCFISKMPKDGEALKKLAEDLDLQTYGLIKNKNSADITEYLAKKMTKSLTGKDPDEKDPKKILESLKWENQKIVDQRVFIELYTNQLVKGALFEVSRYCFENLEITGKRKDTNTDIETYWSTNINDVVPDTSDPTGQTKITVIKNLSDTGSTSFLNIASGTDMSKKDEIYKEVIKGLSGSNIKPSFHKQFFPFCQSAIKRLCDDFRGETIVTTTAKTSSVANSKTMNTMTRGANSCLTMDRLKSMRTALNNTALVAKQFEEMGEKKGDFALQMIRNPETYQRGKGKNEESLDELSNLTSSDMLENESQNNLKDLEKKCAQPGANDPECDEFLVKSDSLNKAIYNLEYQMNLKREVEKARVAELKKNKPKELEEYLKENGMYDLAETIKTNPNFDIEGAIGTIYDARKVAEIQALKSKVGKRQMSETEINALPDKSAQIKANIKESKEERARMAQVVLFNNIITSQLELFEQDGKTSIGRNVGGWTKEYEGLNLAGDGIDMDLFKGIQKDAVDNGNKSEDTSIAGSGIIDSILGKPKD
jgi:hypothetical protein